MISKMLGIINLIACNMDATLSQVYQRCGIEAKSTWLLTQALILVRLWLQTPLNAKISFPTRISLQN